MAGIGVFSSYLPVFRVPRRTVGGVWGHASAAGERPIASYDEDSLTMAADALATCIGHPLCRAKPDGVFFASTTAPYWEKQSSSLLAVVSGLGRSAITADFASSLRAGTAAVKSAVDAVSSGAAKSLMVVASDCRPAQPGTPFEAWTGDSAACLEIVGDERQCVAEIEAIYQVNEEFLDVWRRSDEEFVNGGDPLFGGPHGYVRLVSECILGLLQKANLNQSHISRIAVNGPDYRSYQSALAKAGFSQDFVKRSDAGHWLAHGDTGTTAPFSALAQVLMNSQPGDRVILAAYGNGNCDCLLLRVNGRINEMKSLSPGPKALASKIMDYSQYLRLKGLLTDESLNPYSSPALLWKEQKQNLLLMGTRCRQCSTFAYPRRRVCLKCGSNDDFEDAGMGRTGRIYTFSVERVFPSPGPTVCMAVADMEGGGRFYAQVADCEPGELKVGAPVELCLRKLHDGGGYRNYYWKFRLSRANC